MLYCKNINREQSCSSLVGQLIISYNNCMLRAMLMNARNRYQWEIDCRPIPMPVPRCTGWWFCAIVQTLLPRCGLKFQWYQELMSTAKLLMVMLHVGCHISTPLSESDYKPVVAPTCMWHSSCDACTWRHTLRQYNLLRFQHKVSSMLL